MKTHHFIALSAAALVEACSANAPEDWTVSAQSLTAEDTSNWVIVPGGRRVHPSCVHEVPNGATISADGTVTLNDHVISTTPTCEHSWIRAPGIGGWVENTNENVPTAGDYFTRFENQWTVPAIPANPNDGQLIYLFPSLQTAALDYIAQPVLQWGQNNRFGGSYWVLDSWVVQSRTCGQYCSVWVVSTPLTVNVGDTLDGNIFVTTNNYNGNCAPVSTGVQATDITHGGYTLIFAPLEVWASAQSGVLEVYGSANGVQCADFPASPTSFTAPTLYEAPSRRCGAIQANIPGSWTSVINGGNWPPTCGYSVGLGPTGAATLSY